MLINYNISVDRRKNNAVLSIFNLMSFSKKKSAISIDF